MFPFARWCLFFYYFSWMFLLILFWYSLMFSYSYNVSLCFILIINFVLIIANVHLASFALILHTNDRAVSSIPSGPLLIILFNFIPLCVPISLILSTRLSVPSSYTCVSCFCYCFNDVLFHYIYRSLICLKSSRHTFPSIRSFIFPFLLGMLFRDSHNFPIRLCNSLVYLCLCYSR